MDLYSWASLLHIGLCICARWKLAHRSVHSIRLFDLEVHSQYIWISINTIDLRMGYKNPTNRKIYKVEQQEMFLPVEL
jgi:hypothetical protein